MSGEAAELLYDKHAPSLLRDSTGAPDIRSAAVEYQYAMNTGEGEDRSIWWSLSSGEQAFVRLALSLWGAPGVTCSLYRDLGALDSTLRTAVVATILTAAGMGRVTSDGTALVFNSP